MGILSIAVHALALVSVATAGEESNCKCGPSAVKLRGLPTIESSPPGWSPPPSGWIFKPWNQVNTTNTQVAQLRNFQWDPTPIDPANPDGPINDLSTFQIPGNDTVHTSYGVATPNPAYLAVYDFRGTGILENATSQYTWLGWGCDGNDMEYYVSYATAAEASGTPDGIDIMSLVDTGLDKATTDAIIQSLKQSKSEVIRQAAEKFVPNVQDGSRRHLGRITKCDEKCKTNENLIGIIG